MGSGAIYAVIVALWALVLIPLWLRNHDRSGEVRTIDRNRAALSTLYNESGHRASPSGSASGASVDSGYWHEPTPAEIAAGRRRVVMAVLIGLFVGALALVLLGILPLWFLLLPTVLVFGFSLLGRQQARVAEREARRRASRAEASAPMPEVRQPQVRTRSARYADVPARSTTELPEVRRASYESGANDWDAVNAPLPTYVSAPKASRVPRVIDLRHTGDWGGEAMVEQAQRMRSTARDDADYVVEEMRQALPGDDDAFFDQLAQQTRQRRVSASDGFFDQEAPRAVND